MISVQKLLEIAERRRGYRYVTLVPAGYGEPGYDTGKPVVLGNWNNIDRYDPATRTRVDVDNTMERLAKIFKYLGWEVDWEDEYCSCSECGRAIRTKGDSYSWQMYGWADDGEFLCGDCIKEYPERYLEFLDGNPRVALTIHGIDLSQHGYRLYQDGFENGFYPGQTDDPKKIAKELRAGGIEHFIFVLDHVDQFDISFSVWVK